MMPENMQKTPGKDTAATRRKNGKRVRIGNRFVPLWTVSSAPAFKNIKIAETSAELRF